MTIESEAIEEGGQLPVRYARDGKDLSPPVGWSDVPRGTRELALVCENVTEPWVQWLVYDIPPELHGLPEGLKHKREPDAVSVVQGTNSRGNVGYDGPVGAEGRKYRYVFRLYALDRELAAPPGLTFAELERQMQGHIKATAELHALYLRPRG